MLTTPLRRVRRRPVRSDDLLDRRGYPRSPITFPAYRLGQRPPNAGLRLPVEVLTGDEVHRLLEACGDGPAGPRNRAMLVLMWRAGLRCAETLALTPKDLDVSTGRVQVLHGKGDRRRLVAIDPDAIELLRPWLQQRQELGFTRIQPLVCVMQGPTAGLPLGHSYVRALCKQLAAAAHIEKRVHPHGLRHTYAAYLAEQGVPVHHIRRMLGHSSLAVTERYIDHLNPWQSVEVVRSVSWPEIPRSLASS